MIDKEKCEAFLLRRSDQWLKEKNGLEGAIDGKGDGPLKGGYLLHDALLRATFDVPPDDTQRRRASLCLDGTPIVYSHKLKPQADQLRLKADELPFRMLVEPGGLGITVAEQIDRSLRTVDALLYELGWESTVEDLNAVVRRVFPRRASELSHWLGGIWLGLDFTPQGRELRIYLNMRYGCELARWQRLADVLSWFSDPSLTPPLAGSLKSLIEHVSPYAIPVGLGLVVSQRLRNFRLYTGIQEPSLSTIMQAWPNQPKDATRTFGHFCNAFTRACGPFARQSVTFGFDFALNQEGFLHPGISRTKLDVSCQVISHGTASVLLPVLRDLFDTWHMDSGSLDTFIEDLWICFGGSSLEHVSLGFGDQLEHATIYTKPHGFDQI
ncbi:MAG: hypothetical protein AB1847_22595 [bacterium]